MPSVKGRSDVTRRRQESVGIGLLNRPSSLWYSCWLHSKVDSMWNPKLRAVPKGTPGHSMRERDETGDAHHDGKAWAKRSEEVVWRGGGAGVVSGARERERTCAKERDRGRRPCIIARTLILRGQGSFLLRGQRWALPFLRPHGNALLYPVPLQLPPHPLFLGLHACTARTAFPKLSDFDFLFLPKLLQVFAISPTQIKCVMFYIPRFLHEDSKIMQTILFFGEIEISFMYPILSSQPT